MQLLQPFDEQFSVPRNVASPISTIFGAPRISNATLEAVAQVDIEQLLENREFEGRILQFVAQRMDPAPPPPVPPKSPRGAVARDVPQEAESELGYLEAPPPDYETATARRLRTLRATMASLSYNWDRPPSFRSGR